MRVLLVLAAALALLVACGGGEDASDTTVASSSTVTGATAPSSTGSQPSPVSTTLPTSTSSPVSSAPTTTLPGPDQIFCSDLVALGYTYDEALDYWLGNGAPERMDADGNGVPCETTYDPLSVQAVLSTLAPVTKGEVFPSALSRDLIPWTRLGPGWYLATFQGSDVWGESAESMTVRPTVLYLVHQDGRVYEVTNWPGSGVEKSVQDWSTDGRFIVAVVYTGSSPPWTIEATVVDLMTLEETVIAEGTAAEPVENHVYSFTRPTGRNIVDLEDDWESGEQVLRRVGRDGSLIATVATQKTEDWMKSLDYLYLYDGTGLVISGVDGLSIVGIDGSFRRALWTPDGMWCKPEHWYDADTIAVACYSPNPDVLPHEFFAETWLIPADGSTGKAVTDKLTSALVAEGIHIGMEGFHGAWPTADGILVQGVGDCSTAWIEILGESGESIGQLPGNRLEGVHDGIAVIRTWDACDGTPGSLITSTTDGRFLSELVEARDPIGGITTVHGLADVYP